LTFRTDDLDRTGRGFEFPQHDFQPPRAQRLHSPIEEAAVVGGVGFGRDHQMLEYTQGLPETKVGAFSHALYEDDKNKNWSVISMKNDGKRIFAFDKQD
jgi:hypothetical protein